MSDFTLVFSGNEVAGVHLYEAPCRYLSAVNLMFM